MYQVDKEYQPPIIPPVPQPKGLKFFWGTWSGRFILINTVFFVILTLESGSLMDPGPESLIRWGAKENILIAQGEIWRLITPIVLHVGFIHFAFNNWALYALGYQIEHLLGKKWFVTLYILAGFGGNIASSLFSINLSAGASSSLFGLLGAGFYMERVVGEKLKQMFGKGNRQSMYSGMVIANGILGFMIPQIDNAAHMGGLVCGVVFTYALIRARPNRLVPLNIPRARAVVGALLLVMTVGGVLAASPTVLQQRLLFDVRSAEDPRLQFYLLSKILSLTPEDDGARLQRLELSLKYGNYSTAKKDFFLLIRRPQNDSKIKRIETKLSEDGHREAVIKLREFWSQVGPSL
ncbi:rhomboid family intramembrane serine protease [Pseudobacteriovorax antillogorgiicola]|uniref:Membrane associated serine protease, rhomboid family n=1 Tax=Pseudobacteriovorax antillogorgiicola TaxID=1513793 RepID=A0A1Y6B5Z5_9BACT|nr:rhomboid family intramembrane serine protease [Pseudobacteriovorax antillogorgiicola]TCS59295.1 membrane associated rhomboid family serine protease [Pseudobacteriovorax antillogorgiicola]SME89648.1 Membrane associated serine protease, rhomboid family [Pseudobacteriovorax antillogorgiicola]